MSLTSPISAVETIRETSHRLEGAPGDYDSLMEMVGDARLVLLGEASHGTHEFYKARAEITKRLICEKGFSVLAWEADWPDALRINRYIHGGSRDKTLPVIGSITESHSSLAAWKSAALVRARPFWVVSQPGKPPESVSALMYGPGRAMT